MVNHDSNPRKLLVFPCLSGKINPIFVSVEVGRKDTVALGFDRGRIIESTLLA